MAPKAEKNAHIYTLQDSLQEPPGVPFDDLCNGVSLKSKRVRTGKDTEVHKNSRLSIPATSTLMEEQEFGEMMEHVDEVNFALDGLRKGQPVTNRRDQYDFLQGVQRIKEWGSESERNQRFIVDNGTPSVLASGFHKFASDSINENVCVLEEMLNALIWMLLLQFDAQKIFDLQNPCFAWFGSRRIKIPPTNVKLQRRNTGTDFFPALPEFQNPILDWIEYENRVGNLQIEKVRYLMNMGLVGLCLLGSGR